MIAGLATGWPVIEVAVSNEQSRWPVDVARLQAAAAAALRGEGVENATVSIAIVGDAAIHELNRRYLNHDYATDVLSFLLEAGPDGLEGEIIASADTAAAAASRYGWTPAAELLLYVIHGTLHLAGLDDHDPAARRRMRERENACLREFGLIPRHYDS